MEFAVNELLKFGVAGGLILFTVIRLFAYLEKRDTARMQDGGGIDRAVLNDLREYMVTQTSVLREHSIMLARLHDGQDTIQRTLDSHAEEVRTNFRDLTKP